MRRPTRFRGRGGLRRRLLAAPVVGLGVALVLDFGSAMVARVFVLECATPAAITSLILLIEFSGDRSVSGVSGPKYVSAAVLTTTLVSVPVLTLLIAALESNLVSALL